jgi:protein subunit release factor A
MNTPINPEDLIIQISANPDYAQHLHAPSLCKITHRPTGVSVSYHKGRSGLENKKMAVALLVEQLLMLEGEKKPQS